MQGQEREQAGGAAPTLWGSGWLVGRRSHGSSSRSQGACLKTLLQGRALLQPRDGRMAQGAQQSAPSMGSSLLWLELGVWACMARNPASKRPGPAAPLLRGPPALWAMTACTPVLTFCGGDWGISPGPLPVSEAAWGFGCGSRRVKGAGWLSPYGFFVFDAGHLGHSLFIFSCECAQQGCSGLRAALLKGSHRHREGAWHPGQGCRACWDEGVKE